MEVSLWRVKFDIQIAGAVFHSANPEEPHRASLQMLIAGIRPGRVAQTDLDRVTAELAPKQPARAFTFERRWKPDPDVTTIRITVRDQVTGQYGSVDVPLNKVPQR